jgi:competence protein ComEA
LIIAIVLVGFSSVGTDAAEAIKKVTGDRITPPTKIKPLDINSASIDQLRTIPGIDAVHAQKIVESRPYQKKDELLSRKIIPEDTITRSRIGLSLYRAARVNASALRFYGAAKHQYY